MPLKETVKRANLQKVAVVNRPTILYGGTDYDANRDGVDAYTNASMFIDFEHHEIHEGDHYFIKNYVDLPLNNVYDIQLTTPNTAKWLNVTFRLGTEAETDWMVYEGVTIVTPGTTIPAYNNNRNSANTSGATIAGILNTSTALANADTTVAGATLLAQGKSGSGFQGEGFVNRGNEVVLKQNTNYAFRAVATAAGYVDFLFEWYEHTGSN